MRGGYSLAFVNEEAINVASGASRGNAGLSTAVNLTNQYATVSGALPLPTTPVFLSQRTLADQTALSPTGVFWGIDPDLHAPHVHEVSLGIQRELARGTAVEARYVGTFGRDIWRGVDLNQMVLTPTFSPTSTAREAMDSWHRPPVSASTRHSTRVSPAARR